MVELLDACATIYGELASGPVSFEFAKIGHLLISEDEPSLAKSAAVADSYRTAGVAIEAVTGAELARAHPCLKLKVAGGYFVERAYTVEPMGATHAFAHAAREAGARIMTGARVPRADCIWIERPMQPRSPDLGQRPRLQFQACEFGVRNYKTYGRGRHGE